MPVLLSRCAYGAAHDRGHLFGRPRSPQSDGIGNNIANTNWGAADVYVRVTANSYADGLSQMEIGPAPRDISNAILAQPQVNGVDVDLPSAAELNEFFQFFGQFVTHDITEAAAGNRCLRVRFLPLALLDFPRASTSSAPGFTTDGSGVRQQFSVETSFLDLSMVYGANTTMLNFFAQTSLAEANRQSCSRRPPMCCRAFRMSPPTPV